MSGAQASAAVRTEARPRGRWPVGGWLVAGLAIGVAVWVGIAQATPQGVDPLPVVNRWLVRAGLPFFVLLFAAGPIARLRATPWTRRLVRERRGVGLCWAMIHLTHAAAIMASWGGEGGELPDAVTLVVGGFGFVLTALLAATSNDASQRALGRRWVRLHRTGIWYLMFIYVVSYAGNVAEQPTAWKTIALALMLGLVGLRAAAWWLRRRRASGASVASLAAGA